MKLGKKTNKICKTFEHTTVLEINSKRVFFNSSWTTATWVREINYFKTNSVSKLYIIGVRSRNPNQSGLEKLFNRRNPSIHIRP
jgi:hypothetical protein